MNIFITGATGFIGSKLTQKLALNGHNIRVLIRNPQKAKVLEHSNIRIYIGDISDQGMLKDAMSDCDWVFHLAAYTKVWARDRDIYYKYNVKGTENVLNCAKESGIKRVIIISTAGVLGPSDGGSISESTVRQMDFFTEYERTKSLADEKAMSFAGQQPEIIILYPTRVFGPGLLSESNSVTKLIDAYARGKWRIIPGNGKKLGNYVYIDNLVDGIIKAAELGKPGSRYILGGSDVSYNDFFETIARVTGKSYFMIKIPLGFALAISWILTFLAKITGNPPLLTPAWVRKYLHDWSTSSSKAVKELGYQTGNFEDEVERTWQWLKS
ncbi:MAG: NAD-dependent epimerase/dehydratase family protein [Bacteroidales bacterium]|nr:MAG: NAD-dependent epimerase/dehydratase family protein [Bacteroidales bacterium]